MTCTIRYVPFARAAPMVGARRTRPTLYVQSGDVTVVPTPTTLAPGPTDEKSEVIDGMLKAMIRATSAPMMT